MSLADSDSQDTLKHALNAYFGTLYKIGIELNKDESTGLITGLFNTYKQYEECYPVRIKGHDIYKIFAWAPYVLCDVKKTLTEDEKDIIIATAVHHLCALLARNRLTINAVWVDKLILLARNGLRPDLENISIGKIGLYTAFKTTLHIKSVSNISSGLNISSTQETLDTLFGVV